VTKRAPIHPLLQAGFEGMGPYYVHNAEIHMAGPPPHLSGRDQVEIAIHCARTLMPMVPDDERLAVEEVLHTAVGLLDRKQQSIPEDDKDRLTKILARARPWRDQTQARSVTGLAAAAAEHLLEDRGTRNIHRAARRAVNRTTRILQARKRQGLPNSYDFVVGLDAMFMRLEFATLVGRRLPEAATRLRAVLYRGGTGEDWHGNLHIGIYALDTGYAALIRTDRLRWFNGGRDEVIASIPDEHFELATLSIFIDESDQQQKT
jgi:hypothetical protein